MAASADNPVIDVSTEDWARLRFKVSTKSLRENGSAMSNAAVTLPVRPETPSVNVNVIVSESWSVASAPKLKFAVVAVAAAPAAATTTPDEEEEEEEDEAEELALLEATPSTEACMLPTEMSIVWPAFAPI